MKKNLSVVLMGAVMALTLTSCSFENPFGIISSSDGTTSGDLSITNSTTSSGSVTQGSSSITFKDQRDNAGMFAAPSTGNAKMLVIPINFSTEASVYTNTNEAGIALKDQLTKSFFGTASDTEYWESLSSYYAKSSYQKLNITGTVTKYINFNMSAAQIESDIRNSNGAKDSTNYTNLILQQSLAALIDDGLNYSDYDSNNDGVIDFIWLVYTKTYNSSESTRLEWAYTYWDYWDDTSYSSSELKKYAHAYNYSWASAQFMYEGSDYGKDSHTFIHETGHQMGLDDYYSYDSSTKTTKARSPMGGVDMMDNNIVDHCSFTKYCLDWTTPTVGEADKTYTLKPFESSGDSLIIAANYDGTMFDEYFICEYYTPTGLNELDSTTTYSSVKGLTSSGLRILHVDQRIGLLKYNKTNGWYWTGSYASKVDVTNITNTEYYSVISSNSKKYCLDSTDYSLVSLVQASGNTNLLSDSKQATSNAVNSDLFTTTSKVFGKDVNPTTDEGWTIPFQVNITSMDSTGLTLSLTANS